MANAQFVTKTQSNGNELSVTIAHISKRSPRTWKTKSKNCKAEQHGEFKEFMYVLNV